MFDNRKNISDLNKYCQLEIIKYIIADCEMRDTSQDSKIKYVDLVNFALAHKNFEEIIKDNYEDLYKSLEFVFVANRRELEIDLSELETIHTGKEEVTFWRFFAKAIRQNKVVYKVTLNYHPKSFQPNFEHHFQRIKRALKNKKSLCYVTISLNGYFLEDLNNFRRITDLELDGRVSAEALVKVCKSNSRLHALRLQSTEILGRLSDIVPHCPNLAHLSFVAKPDIGLVEYAPLAELPYLQKIIIYGAFENGSLLKIFEEITKWKRERDGLDPLEITFSELLPHLRNVYIAKTNSIVDLYLRNDAEGIKVSVSYDLWDISRDRSPLAHSIATIPLIEAELKIDYKQLTLYECPKSDTDRSGFISILKLLNIKTIQIHSKKDQIKLFKLIASIVSGELYALKSIETGSTKIDKFATSELVKITSITSLTCKFSEWESVELLSALTNLETVNVYVEKEFEMTSLEALSSLINTCSSSGVIRCSDLRIGFRNIEGISSQRKRITALTICDKGKAISHIFEAFSYRDLITIKELDVSKCKIRIGIKDILKMAEVHPIKKLTISLADTNDIEHLSDLAELEELTIYDSEKGSLIKLFDQIAMKTTPSLQCLKIESKELSTEELVRVSKIRSLKKLDLCVLEPVDCALLMELANSDIEELSLAATELSLQRLLCAFSVITTTRIQQLKIKKKLQRNFKISDFDLEKQPLKITELPNRYLDISELEELSKMKSLKSLLCTCLHNDVSFLRNFKHLVKLDIEIFKKSNLGGLRCLAELEKLESLTLRSYEYEYSFLTNNDILADIQNLKELNLLVGRDDYDLNNDYGDNVNLTNVYQAFVRKNVKLTHLTTTIRWAEELSEITQIKSLRKLNLYIPPKIGMKVTGLGELSELESLQITVMLSTFGYMVDDYDDYITNCVLPILKCCKNLDRLLINTNDWGHSILNYIYEQLKSIRDPTLQGPLTVILTELEDYNPIYKEYNIPEILVIPFENAYMKVFSSSKGYYLSY